MLEQMEISFKHYKSLGYNVIYSYNKDSDIYIKKETSDNVDIWNKKQLHLFTLV